MPADLPYLASYKNVAKLFANIADAKIPNVVSVKFLSESLGITSPSDRPLIPLLRSLGFTDPSNKPTAAYASLKNSTLSAKAIAKGIREAYAPLFAANEKANTLTGDQLKGLIAQVAGTDVGMTAKIAGTFGALVKLGDFSESTGHETPKKQPPSGEAAPVSKLASDGGLRPEFTYDIHIHLPANGSEETYMNIFNALRKSFK